MLKLFDIQLTPGHLIVGIILVILYDSLWTWVFKNSQSAWWFERLQGLLKLGIYGAALTFTILVAVTPLPWNVVLVISAALTLVCIYFWLKKRMPVKGSLRIDITVPGKTAATVVITGPGGFTHTVKKTELLTDLVPGDYEILAADIKKGSTTLKPTIINTPTPVVPGRMTITKVIYA